MGAQLISLIAEVLKLSLEKPKIVTHDTFTHETRKGIWVFSSKTSEMLPDKNWLSASMNSF